MGVGEEMSEQQVQNAVQAYLQAMITLVQSGQEERGKQDLERRWPMLLADRNVSRALAAIFAGSPLHEFSYRLLTEWTAKHGDDGQIYSLFGHVCFERGLYEKAEQHLQKSLALAPKDAVTYVRLANVYEKQHRYDDGAKILAAGLSSLEPTPILLDRMAQYAMVHHLPEFEPFKLREIAAELEPDNYVLQHNLANMLRPADSIPYFQKILEKWPEATESHISYALSLFSLGRLQEGWAHYQYRLTPNRGAENRLFILMITRCGRGKI